MDRFMSLKEELQNRSYDLNMVTEELQKLKEANTNMTERMEQLGGKLT